MWIVLNSKESKLRIKRSLNSESKDFSQYTIFERIIAFATNMIVNSSVINQSLAVAFYTMQQWYKCSILGMAYVEINVQALQYTRVNIYMWFLLDICCIIYLFIYFGFKYIQLAGYLIQKLYKGPLCSN